MNIRLLFLAFCLSGVAACRDARPRDAFNASKLPPAPDYQSLSYWAAHPEKPDPADRTPNRKVTDNQQNSAVDVFFLHPTTYTGSRRYERQWNGDVQDAQLNEKTDGSSILYQASLFNGAGKVYAPRYRQAHLNVFFGKDKASNKAALDVAYSDVKAAFEHYLKHWNRGRPFILAGHSQGALHAMQLIRELVEDKPLAQQMVAAYIVGWPVPNGFFKSVKPCAKPDDTACFCSWRTWERRYGRRKAFEDQVICTNPLIWTTQPGVYAQKSTNLGAVIRPFEVIRPAVTDAEVYRGVLLSKKPKFPGSFLLVKKNYHVGDLNLFYMNVRENAILRASKFLKQ